MLKHNYTHAITGVLHVNYYTYNCSHMQRNLQNRSAHYSTCAALLIYLCVANAKNECKLCSTHGATMKNVHI